MEAMTEQDIEKILTDLKQRENSWLYQREIVWYESWLKYYRACHKETQVKSKTPN